MAEKIAKILKVTVEEIYFSLSNHQHSNSVGEKVEELYEKLLEEKDKVLEEKDKRLALQEKLLEEVKEKRK